MCSNYSTRLEDCTSLKYLVRMATTVEKLVEEAVTLPGESRARLVDLLVESLDGEELSRID